MTTLNRRQFAIATAMVAATALAPQLAAALTLDQAKASGLVGEMPNGYVGAVRGGGDVRALVDSVNAQRRASYREVAADNGVPLAVVEQQAGARLIARAPTGQFVMNSSGQWIRK